MKSESLRFGAGTFVLALGAVLALNATAQELPTVDDLFRRHFTSVGTTQALEQAKCVVVTGTLVSQGGEYPFTFSSGAAGTWRFEIRDAGKPIVFGRDAEGKRWTRGSAAGFLPEDAVDLLALAVVFSPSAQRFLHQRLAEAVCEPALVRKRAAYAVGRGRQARSFPRVFFDAETGLICRVNYTLVEDYRPDEGILTPHTLRAVDGAVFRISAVSYPGELSADLFSEPGRKTSMLGTFAPLAGAALHQRVTVLSRTGSLEIVRHPAPAGSRVVVPREVPRFDPLSGRHAQVRLQGADLRKLDLSDRAADLFHADFDTRTLWPERMPAEFRPAQVLEFGKNPGLGVRAVHRRGITGKQVGIGFIDFPLLTTHEEYAERLRLYEEIDSGRGQAAHMHGAGVASIALGRTCGVAPGAELYYIASCNLGVGPKGPEADFRPIARSVHRLLDINAQLPADRRIRVIALAMGWTEDQTGFKEMTEAVARATSNNVFVISSSSRSTHGLWFDGLNRPATADPDCFESYGPGSWWAGMFWSGEMRFKPGKRLCVPMDGRTLASPAGPGDYVHYDYAGWSWAIPWIAGLYALACEVYPEITPEVFWSEALRTGTTLQLRHEGEVIPFGTIANPAGLIDALLSRQRAG